MTNATFNPKNDRLLTVVNKRAGGYTTKVVLDKDVYDVVKKYDWFIGEDGKVQRQVSPVAFVYLDRTVIEFHTGHKVDADRELVWYNDHNFRNLRFSNLTVRANLGSGNIPVIIDKTTKPVQEDLPFNDRILDTLDRSAKDAEERRVVKALHNGEINVQGVTTGRIQVTRQNKAATPKVAKQGRGKMPYRGITVDKKGNYKVGFKAVDTHGEVRNIGTPVCVDATSAARKYNMLALAYLPYGSFINTLERDVDEVVEGIILDLLNQYDEPWNTFDLFDAVCLRCRKPGTVINATLATLIDEGVVWANYGTVGLPKHFDE